MEDIGLGKTLNDLREFVAMVTDVISASNRVLTAVLELHARCDCGIEAHCLECDTPFPCTTLVKMDEAADL